MSLKHLKLLKQNTRKDAKAQNSPDYLFFVVFCRIPEMYWKGEFTLMISDF